MSGSAPSVMPAIYGLFGFIALFAVGVALLRWLQKRMGAGLGMADSRGDVRVVRRTPLGWQSLLMVVEVGGRQYVIATSRGGGVTLIDKLDEPLGDPPGQGAFARSLRSAFSRQGRSQ